MCGHLFKTHKVSKILAVLCVLNVVRLIMSSNVSKNEHDRITHLPHQPINYLDKLQNFSVQEKSRTLRNCGSFFHEDDFVKYFQECLTSQSSTRKLGAFASESGEIYVADDSTGRREKRFAPGKYSDIRESRRNQDAPYRQSTNKQEHGYWKMFENSHVFTNPCLISCVLTKFELINSTGHADLKKIESRVKEVLASGNVTDFVQKASNITETCTEERDSKEKMLYTGHKAASVHQDPSSVDLTRAKCRFVIQLGKCLSHHVFAVCHENLLVPHDNKGATTVPRRE